MKAALASQARAANMPTERYVAWLVERALENRRRDTAGKLARHLDSMAAQVAPDTTPEEMESALEEALAATRPHRGW